MIREGAKREGLDRRQSFRFSTARIANEVIEARLKRSGAAFEPFVKENDEQTDYGNNAKNDESYSEGVHLDTSMLGFLSVSQCG